MTALAQALVRQGAVYKYDVSLPTRRMYELVERMRLRLQEARRGAVALPLPIPRLRQAIPLVAAPAPLCRCCALPLPLCGCLSLANDLHPPAKVGVRVQVEFPVAGPSTGPPADHAVCPARRLGCRVPGLGFQD